LPKDYKSISQVIASNLPSIANIKKSDPDLAIEVIIEFITDLVEFLNVGKIMNIKQIDQTAEYILQYFPHFNLADLRLFFDKMKLGHYGKFYDSVDGQLVLSKMEEYNQDRMNEFEIIKLRLDREEIKNNPIGEGYHPDVILAIKNAIGVKKPFVQTPTVRVPSDGEVFHQRCLKQFDNLFRKYGKKLSSVRFLSIGNKLITVDAFIELKINNQLSKNGKH